MDNIEPLVSVVLPVYNRPTVVDTIASVLNQTYSNYELIIIDNASTDNTVEKINEIGDSRIRVFVNEENKGQTYSINRGLELSKGKYIARIDADDLMVSERLEKQVKFLEDNPDFGLVGSWVQYITLSNKKAFVVKMPISDKGMRIMQTIACGMFHPAAMLRKSLLDEYKITYDSNMMMAEDYDMWRKIMQYSKALNLPEVLTLYRKGDNDSVRHADIMHKECCSIRKVVCENELKGSIHLNKMQEIIEIEDKNKKNLLDIIKICSFYKDYILTELGDTEDFNILMIHIRLKIYSDIAANNNTLYARFFVFVYKFLKKIRYVIGK